MTHDDLSVTVRPLKKTELAQAHQIFRMAFGTFIGLPDPLAFGGDTDFVRPRWQEAPDNAFAAEMSTPSGTGKPLAGTNFVMRWGNFAWFGPLTVVPEYWNKGVGTKLTAAVAERMDQWGTQHRGLFTFSNSPKHLELYRKFGYWPRSLMAIMEWPFELKDRHDAPHHETWTTWERVSPADRERVLKEVREFTNGLLSGLDLTEEILNIEKFKLGETILIYDGSRLAGLACTHIGPGSEAGSGAMYVRFAAVCDGCISAFEQMLSACAAVARGRGAAKLVAGASLECEMAYVKMRELGAKIALQGITMHGRNDPAYFRKQALVLGDWR